jgi:hypothetical protein
MTVFHSLAEELAISDRNVQVVSLDAARRVPLLLADALRDGRTLVDRDGNWPKLKRAQGRIEREARQAETELDEQVAELAQLVAAEI